MPGAMPGSQVLEFYNGGNIFLTGATGFLGKVTLEKFLRVCPNINHIYILVRVKKGKNPQDRIRTVFDDPLFDTLRKERPDFEKKVTSIPGDISMHRLGMSDNDYDFLVEEITHVIHSAATVRFNEKLKSAISINVFGTMEVLAFCKKCIRLKILVHVSTAYANCHRYIVDEKYYDPPMSADAAINIGKLLDSDKLDSITEELIKPWPNTYSFTKAIAENAIKEYGKTIPAVIFRPSIVMGALKEPIPGWIDNIYGPTGVIVATGAGLLRVLLADKTKVANIVPVDLAVNAILCCSWETGTSYNNNTIIENSLEKTTTDIKKTESVAKIFNFVSRPDNSLTWADFHRINLAYGLKFPLRRAMWYYSMTMTRIKLLYFLLIFFCHTIPAYIFDGGLYLLGRKPQIRKAYEKIHTFGRVMEVFAVNDWKFSDENTRQLWYRLSDADKKLFDIDMSIMNWPSYFEIVVNGVRRFIFKEDESEIRFAQRRFIFLWLGHRLIQTAVIGLFVWVLYKLFSINSYGGGLIDSSFEQNIMTKPELIRNSL